MRKIYFIFIVMLFFIACRQLLASEGSKIVLIDIKNEITENGELKITIRKEALIRSKQGHTICKEKAFVDSDQSLNYIKAELKKLDGKLIKRLRQRDININFASYSFYSDAMRHSFNLVHNEFPYLYESEYQYESKNFLAFRSLYPFQYKTDIDELNYSIKVPKDKEINYKCFLLPEPQIINEGNYKIYKWQIENIKYKRSKESALLPPRRNNNPYIKVVPIKFNYYSNGAFESWKSFGEWASKLFKGQDELPDDEKRRIVELTNSCSNEKNKIDVLYKYLQQSTRYINVDIGIDGYKPNTAKFVSENKYGDCKDLTNYMLAMLKHIGIDSKIALTYRKEHFDDIDKDFINQCFNHVILMIPIQNDTIWLECTSDNYPLGFIGRDNSDRHVLLLDGEQSELVKTPAIGLDQNIIHRHYNIELDSNNQTLAKVRTNYYGDFYRKKIFVKDSPKDIVEDELMEVISFDVFKIIKHAYKVSDSIACIYEEIDLELQHFFKEASGLLYFYPPKFELPYLGKMEREVDFYFNSNSNYIDSTTIYINNNNYNQSNTLDSCTITTCFGEYTSKTWKEGPEIKLRRQLKLYKGYFDKSKYADYYDFINTIRKDAKKAFVFEHK